MMPYIYTPFGSVSTFALLIAVGVLAMLMVIHISLGSNEDEKLFIIPKVIFSGVFALLCAGLFDSVFKFLKYGYFQISGITFYGGLIGGIITMYFLLRYSQSKTQYSIIEWFNILTPSLVAFHLFGRIGCFFAGCCYGKTTNSCLGILFPDNAEHEIFHNGLKCYPTQLFEAAILLIIFVILL